MRLLLNLIVITFIALQTPGCSLNKAVAPDVSLADLRFSDATLFETSGRFDIRVQNENPFPLEFEGAAHNIYLNDVHIGKGLVDQSFTVPKLGSATHSVTIHLSNLSLIRNIQNLIDAKDYRYRIESTLYKKGTFGLSSYKVSQSGTFSQP